MNQRIETYGLTRHGMNGKCGLATDFHPAFDTDGRASRSQSRYTVLLDSGKAFKAKICNVRAEVALADSVRPKAKGKGKKGRGKGGK